MHIRRCLVLLAVALPLLAGCGKSSSEAQANPTTPSPKAKMICAPEAQKDIAKALGVRPTKPVKETWAHSRYSCPYVYADGTINLSVKELPDPTNATGAYFSKLEHDLGWNKGEPLTFGDGAFVTTNGSVVVRKDNMVLLVDVQALPDRFGHPANPRMVTAEVVAETIMGCWR